MSSKLVWLDLCSGLGGASQPALDRGWRVIRVDIDPRFKPDIVADVRALPLKPFHVDVLWASPPCQEFSKWGMRCFFPNPPSPDTTIALMVLAAIDRLKPKFWVVENVRASRQWLTRIFGPTRMVSTGHVLWSNLGFLLPVIKPHKGSFHAKHTSGRRWGAMAHEHRSHERSFIKNMKGEAALAAKIPYEIGQAICRTVEARNEITVDGKP